MPPSLPTAFQKNANALRLIAFLVVGFALNPTTSFSQIFQYSNLFTGAGTAASHTTATPLTRGSGVAAATDCTADQGFGSHGWPETTTFVVNDFNAHEWYVDVTITAETGYDLKVTGFSSRLRRENQTGLADDGPLSARYGYQADGGSWVTVNPNSPLSSNVCGSTGTLRAWPSGAFPITVTNSIKFRIYGLSSGANLTGDLFIRDLVVSGDVCAEEPDIVLGAHPMECFNNDDVATVLPYVSSTGTEYIIDYDAAAEAEGFTDQLTYTVLPVSPKEIPITIPGGAAPGVYNGTITVRNACEFVDPSPAPFSVKVKDLPEPGIEVVESSGVEANDNIICEGGSATLTATGGFSYEWSTGETSSEITVSPTSTTTYTVIVTSETNCTAVASQEIVVKTVTATPNAGDDQFTCVNGIVHLNGTITGTPATGTWSASIPGGSFNPDANLLETFYYPPADNTAPITLTLTSGGDCPVTDELVVEYGDLPDLQLNLGQVVDEDQCDDQITVVVVANGGFNNMSSLQYSLMWDPAVLQFGSYTATNIDGDPIVNTLGAANGKLSYLWFDGSGVDGENLDEESLLLTLHFTAIGNALSTTVMFADLPTPFEATTSQLCQLNPYLVNTEVFLSPAIQASIVVDENGDQQQDDNLICKGDDLDFIFTESNYPQGTLFNIAFTAEDANGVPQNLAYNNVVNGDALSLTEGIDFSGNLSVTNIVVTHATSECAVELSDIQITVNPPFTVSVAGQDTVHVGAAILLVGSNDITLPNTVGSITWTSADEMIATVSNAGYLTQDSAAVTGVSTGITTIYYTVVDNAGCQQTTAHEVTVIETLTLTSSFVDDISKVACGDLVKVKVRVSNFTDISGLTFSVNWDDNQFDFAGIEPLPFPLVSEVSVPGVVGHLDFLWLSDPTYLENGTVILCYNLRAKGSSGAYPITVDDEVANNSSLLPVPVISNDLEATFLPLSLSLQSPINICPADETATLSIFDVVGTPDSYSIQFEDDAFTDVTDLPLTVTNGTGEITISLPDNLPPGPYNAILVVKNQYGCESTTYDFQLIMDQELPYADIDPAEVDVACLEDVPEVDINVVIDETDNCTTPGNLVITHEGDVSNEGGGCVGDPIVITRTYRVTDEAGNFIFVEQTITVVDDIAPVIDDAFALAPWYLSAEDILADIDAKLVTLLTDNCDEAPTYSVIIAPDGGCHQSVTISVTDHCENENVYQYSTVIDAENPTVDGAAPIGSCFETAAAALDAAQIAVTEAANDDCTDPVDLVITAVISENPGCDQTITVTVKDACGKATEQLYQVRIDDAPPVISSLETALNGKCYFNTEDAAQAATEATEATDNCEGDLVKQATVDVEGCSATVTVTVTDGCEHTSSITYTGITIDGIAPTAEGIVETTCFKTLTEAYETLAADANPQDNCATTPDLIASALDLQGENPPSFVYDQGSDCVGKVSLTFTDCSGNTYTREFTGITIDNTAPVWETVPEALDVNVECGDEQAYSAAINAAPVAVDNCTETVTLSMPTEDLLEGNCLEDHFIRKITRTWTATDNCGNETGIYTQIITIVDHLAPTWFTEVNSLDAEVECGDEADLALALEDKPVAEDNCDQELTVIEGDPTTEYAVDCALDGFVKKLTRTWYATDDCGNTSTAFTQVITFIDTQAPIWETQVEALNISVNCGNTSELEAALALAPTATDACAATVTISDPEMSENVSENCQQDGFVNQITRTWYATDDCGNTSTPYVQVITVVDHTAPIWTTPLEQLDAIVECDDAAGLMAALDKSPKASDVCDEEVTLNEPAVNDFTSENCTEDGFVRRITRTWTATDDCGNTSDTYTQVITIIDTQAPVWITLPGSLDGSYECNDIEGIDAAYAKSPVAEDNCDITVFVSIPNEMVENGNCLEDGFLKRITRTWIAADDCAHESVVFTQVITIVDETAPVIGEVQPIGTCYQEAGLAEEDAIVAVTEVTQDACSENLTYSASTTYGTNCSATVTVTVTDECGNDNSYAFETRIDHEAPTETHTTIESCYPTMEDAIAAALDATTFEDNCPGDVTKSFIAEGTCPATITVYGTDGCGNETGVVFENICIDNTPPVFTTEASNQEVACSPTLQTAFQNWLNSHGGAVAAEQVTWSTDPAQPTLSGGCSGGITVTFIAADQCGNEAGTTATFTYYDDTAPTASNPAPLNLTCINDVPAPDPAVVLDEMDVCDQSLTVELFSNTESGLGCPGNPRVYLRTYAVSDDCNNVTYVTHTITVIDNVIPTFTAPANTTVTINGNCQYSVDPTITGDVTDEHDNCSTGLQAMYTDAVAPGTVAPDRYVITRTWTLVDNCGNNAATKTQIIKVQDVTLPTIACPSDVFLQGGVVENNMCAWLGSGLTPTFDDNCDGETLSYSLSGYFLGSSTGTGSLNGKIFLEGETIVTYTVTDAAGNTASCTFKVTIYCTTVSGKIIWEANHAQGVQDATVRLSQGPLILGSTLSNLAGNYSLTVNTPGNYAITPVKNINRLNGVTAADATAIQQHVAGITPISDPYKKVAADINRNGFITNQDANLITQSLAGSPTALAVFNVFWRFVPTAYTMPSPTPPSTVPAFPENITLSVGIADIVGQDFYGMKIGDVNGSANPSMSQTGTPLVWMVKDQMLQAGTEIELNFAATNFTDLAALQFALDFDPEYLQFTGFQSTNVIPMTQDNFGEFNAVLGELRVVWSQIHGMTLADGTPVMKAKFKVLKGGQKLSSVLQLDNSALPGTAYTEALTPSDIRVVFVESVSAQDLVDLTKPQLRLFQNQPNPFAGETTIGFVLPEACEAQLRIMDVSGRELSNYKRNYTAGYHEVEFRMENAAAYGVLYYELTTPYGSLTKKMVTAGK